MDLASVLQETGFIVDGQLADGLLLASQLEQDDTKIDRRARYDAVISESKLGAAAIYELSGAACIYFAGLTDEPSAAELAQKHRLAWNHGLAPLLWIVTPTRVLIYDCFDRPAKDVAASQHVIATFQTTAAGLSELNAAAGREQIDSGLFWRRHPDRLDRRRRVDSQLLADIRATTEQLTNSGLSADLAQKLIGRSIYVAYLIGRGILRPEFLAQFGGADLPTIIASHQRVYDLFRWVEQTFDGDVFPLQGKNGDERDVVSHEHLETVRRFLLAEQIGAGQLSLWPYNFDVIPVELLSSIYEQFTYATDVTSARARSTHYTPLNLVDLVLTQTLEGLDPNARVLDLSCGSGVFLVEAFRRLVAERAKAGQRPDRSVIRSVLSNQIFGVDINPGAVQIAAFSLYLAALELDQAPEPPEALRFEPLQGRNLFAADAFDERAEFNRAPVFQARGFQAIVGNPPWTRSQESASADRYCAKRGLTLARKNPDQAFLWRLADFVNDETRLGLVLSAKPFFATTDAAQTARANLLLRFAPRVLINLSNLRSDDLFANATAPAMVLIADGRASAEGADFAYVSLESSEDFKHHGILEIPPDRVQRLSLDDVCRNPALLKIASWAGPRDALLIARLKATFPNLGALESEWGITIGVGYQLASQKHRTPRAIEQLPALPQDYFTPFRLEALPPDSHPPRFLHRPRDIGIYRAPLLITTRMIGRKEGWLGFASAYSARDVAYDEYFLGISFAESAMEHRREYAHYVNGILNSSLANYYLFLNSAVWGVERDEVRAQDIRALPIPAPEDNPRAASLIIETSMAIFRESYGREIPTAIRRHLDNAVLDLFGLRSSERALVRDFVQFVLPARMGPTTGKKRAQLAAHVKPDGEYLMRYARRLCETLLPLLDALGERNLTADVFPLHDSPIQAVCLRFVARDGQSEPTIRVDTEVTSLGSLGNEVRAGLVFPLGDSLYVRRILRAYIDDAVVIAKPAQQRYWTESAALHDADAILAEDLRIS